MSALVIAAKSRISALPRVSVLVAMLGAVFYGVLLSRSVAMDMQAFGYNFYDQVWLALLDGRLDLPARVLRLEGHYAPDGTGFFYHGLGPLVIRALLDPFVTIGQGSLSPVSIWLWAVAGTALYQAAFLRVVPDAGVRTRAALSALVWFGGPGVILASNHAFYHEPIGLAYALGGAFMLVWVHMLREGRVTASALVGLALVAALCVHARPHLAAALYVGVSLAGLHALWTWRTRLAPPALLAVALLGAGGFGYLALNQARFGDMTATHGSFDKSAIRYGTVFWGLEEEDGLRARAFTEHGRFNAGRIMPNAMIYSLLPPEKLLPRVHNSTRTLHEDYTRPRTGFTRIEPPTAGVLFLWAGWIAAAAFGIAGLRRARPGELALVGVTGVGATLILAYATITMRYLVDLWPLVAALALIGLPRLTARLSEMPPPRSGALLLVAGFSMLLNLQTAADSRLLFREDPSTGFRAWDANTCRLFALSVDLPTENISEVCRDPRVET